MSAPGQYQSSANSQQQPKSSGDLWSQPPPELQTQGHFLHGIQHRPTPRGSSISTSMARGSACSTASRAPTPVPAAAQRRSRAGWCCPSEPEPTWTSAITPTPDRGSSLTNSCASFSDHSSAHLEEPVQSQFTELVRGSQEEAASVPALASASELEPEPASFRARADSNHGSRASSRAVASLAARSQCQLGRRHPSMMPFQAQRQLCPRFLGRIPRLPGGPASALTTIPEAGPVPAPPPG